MTTANPDAIIKPLVLVVEDEILIRMMVVEALDEAGFSSLEAGDGLTGIELMKANREQLRGLVTDVNMGTGMDGWELARAGREQISDLPIVYVSGASGHEWTSRGVPNSLLITKPFATAQIVVALSSLLVALNTTPLVFGR